MHTSTPTEIKLHQGSRLLEVAYDDGRTFKMRCELLRVYSPSAEVQGHSPDQRVLMTGKENVNIKEIQPVGNYAVKLVFDDGHDTGLYTWTYLRELGEHQDDLWREYLDALKAHGYTRQVG